MISPLSELAVCRLLRLGVPHREIADRTGVSKNVVDGIASGRRSKSKSRRAARRRDAEPEREAEVNGGPKKRCPECGGLVVLPCVACETRRRIHRDRDANFAAAVADLAASPIVAFDLRPEHHRRYLEMRRAKVRAGERPAAGAGLRDLLDRIEGES